MDLKNQKFILDIKRQLNWCNHPFDILLKPIGYVYGRLVCRIRAGRDGVRVGGNCLKYVKRGWNRKERRRNKD